MMGLFALLLITIIFSQYNSAMNKAELQKKREKEYGTLSFSGKVVHYRLYKYMSKNYYQVCVKLNQPNAKPLTIFDDDDAIRIANGMATFSAGYYNRVLGAADSVSANPDKSDKLMLYYNAANAVDRKDFNFEPMGLQRTDLDSCK